MQKDFHYYATYCAAFLAGYSHEDSLAIAYSAQLVDDCSATFLKKIKGPISAATTQLQLEMMDLKMDFLSQQNITRIWSSFHFLREFPLWLLIIRIFSFMKFSRIRKYPLFLRIIR